MGIADVVIAAAVVGGSLWLLYRSLWKKKGHCGGCCGSGGTCGKH